MTRDETRALLELLAEFLPAHAPDIDDQLVNQWVINVQRLDFVFAARVAGHLAAKWDKPHFPRPGEFSAARIDIEIRDGIAAARAAVRAAPDLPRI